MHLNYEVFEEHTGARSSLTQLVNDYTVENLDIFANWKKKFGGINDQEPRHRKTELLQIQMYYAKMRVEVGGCANLEGNDNHPQKGKMRGKNLGSNYACQAFGHWNFREELWHTNRASATVWNLEMPSKVQEETDKWRLRLKVGHVKMKKYEGHTTPNPSKIYQIIDSPKKYYMQGSCIKQFVCRSSNMEKGRFGKVRLKLGHKLKSHGCGV